MSRLRSALALGAALTLPAGASAQVIDGVDDLFGTPSVIDFSQFTGGWLHNAGTGGGTQVGSLVGEDVLFLSTASFSVIGDQGYGFGSNGLWSGKSMAGLNSHVGAMTFWFNSGPVSGVGGFLNYSPPTGNAFIEALDLNGNVLESYMLGFATNGATNSGFFFGFQHATNDIAGFRLRDAYVGIDDLSFSRTPTEVVPEPLTMVLLGSGLAGVGAIRRRRPKVETA